MMILNNYVILHLIIINLFCNVSCSRINKDEIEMALDSRNKNGIYIAESILLKYDGRHSQDNRNIHYDKTYSENKIFIKYLIDAYNTYDQKTKEQLNKEYLEKLHQYNPIWKSDWE